jgi:WD40 repeat protein/serine/threonine protein kinase
METVQGTIIRGYEIQEEIGSGGFGTVYRALQSSIGREVSIKVILPQFANQPNFIRRFDAEAQLVARLEHMNIVPLHDYWRDPEGAFLVMRYLRGGNLKETLKQGPLDLETAAQVMDQIAAALSVAHRGQVIHRDIKPSNILLDEDGNAYLSDFGIAKDLEKNAASMTRTNAFVGSPDYLAPEQPRGEAVTPQTDIYSMGILLYEMLVGEHPYPGLSGIERLFKHINEPVPNLVNLDPDVSSPINDVIQKATRKNPEQRYKDVLSMAAAFREAASISVSRAVGSLVELLTPREQEVIRFILDGKTNREIAELMTVELATVKWHVKQIYKKLNVRSRVQAIVKARELNLVIGDNEESQVTGISRMLKPDNPYKGLRAFSSADEQDFFGREKLVQKLLDRLASDDEYSRILAVIGPSGSGKSSLVKAGLIPALWRGEMSGSDKWYVVDFVPGAYPLDELEVALLRVASRQIDNLKEQLGRDARGLIRASKLILPDDDSELLIVIDQFEELFTLVEDEERRVHFLDLLITAINGPRSRVRVVLTLRADFYDRPLHYPEFWELIENRIETVLPLTMGELEQAIAQPAQRVGMVFEDDLVANIIDDVYYQAGALPLLQYALTEMFEVCEGRKLTLNNYEQIGRTTGALTKRAEEVYAELGETGQEACQQMFMRLVTLGEGTEDTRRRVTRSELLSLVEDKDAIDEAIDTYANYRLLSLDTDPTSRTPTVEVAHEAILREWERLRGWLDEARDDIRLQRQVARAANEWQIAEREISFLLRGTRLGQFETWAEETELALTALERQYLLASVNQQKIEEDEEVSRQAREFKLEKRTRTVLRWLVGVFLVAAMVSGGLAVWANIQRQEALMQASIGLAAQSERELGGIDRELGVLLALEAVENYPYTPQAVGALALAIEEFRTFQILSSSESVAELKMVATWSPNGRRVAAASSPSPNSVVIWDVATGSELLSVNPHKDLCRGDYHLIRDLAWSPDGNRLAVIAQDLNSGEACGIVILDTTSGETLLRLVEHESAARSLDWSPDGTAILTGHEDGIVRLWDAHTGTARSKLIGHTGVVRDAIFSPNGSSIASASEDETIRLWDVETGTEQRMLSGHAGIVRSVDWSPDGKRLVSGGNDGLPRVWDVVNGETLFVLPGHTEDIVIVTWSSDGRRIASQSLDATVKVWDAATGGLIFKIINTAPDPSTKRGFVEFSPDDNWILAGGSRVLGIHIWDASTSNPKLFGHNFGQEWGGWSPDGALIATSGSDGSARLWDAATGQQLGEFDQGSYWSDWSPDGTRLVFAEGIEAVALNVWDVTTGEMLSRLSVEEDEFGSHQFVSMDWSPNGSYITAADFRPGRPTAIYVWNAETTELVSTLQADDVCMQGWPIWSPDSTRIAIGCIFVAAGINTPASIWDAATGEALMVLESEYGWTYRTVWSPDGTQILVTYENGAAVIWDVETGNPILTFSEHRGAVDGQWSPDGTLIASTDFENQLAKIWDSETGEVLMSFSVPGAPLTIGWSPDGKHVIVTGDGFNEPIIKRIWASTEEIITHAYECCVTRAMTPEERQQFGLDVGE